MIRRSSMQMSGDLQGSGSACPCLEEEGFRLCCESFLQHARVLDDGWSWVAHQGSEEGYMKNTVLGTGKVLPPQLQEGLCGAGEDLDYFGEDGQVDDQDGGQLAMTGPSVIRYEYHVLYSSSFQSPVLYFRASTLDGRPLSLEEMWDNVHPNYKQRLLQGPWDTITQQEHPLLGQPFFSLHPCCTHELMGPILAAAQTENRSLNYVVSWLSAVGPVVGLHVPLSYAAVGSEPAGISVG